MSKFLILGSGFVAEPALEYLYRNSNNLMTIAGFDWSETQQLSSKFNSVSCESIDVTNKKALRELIQDFDVVLSLVPASMHQLIAEVCILQKTHLVTASYETPAMKNLHEKAKKAGICILNEIGLDPGIDHLAAMEIIDKVQAKGETIESFVSWCGGIPAAEDNDNPLGYKFSWEPKGAIKVLQNDAVYQHNNQEIKINGRDLMTWANAIEIDGLELECYPNRNSINYKDIYGIQSAHDIIRGTLRYAGFCHYFQAIKDLGLMQETGFETHENLSWKEYILNLNDSQQLTDIEEKISPISFQALHWLGCFSGSEYVTPNKPPLDCLCDLLLKKLQYKNNEKDMVVLQHKFVIKKSDGSRYFISSVLKEMGNPNGYSAMAKTVGYPVAMAAELIADRTIQSKGVVLPVTKEIYQPLLKLLKKENIIFQETLITEKELSVENFLQEI
ncbi:MAG: saccharopine dehydrogenase C-terminal domain-containing protein [Marinicellaceae bacterium]